MDIVAKQSRQRKIMSPQDDPMWERKKKIAARRMREGKMKFENEAEERDYRKRVNLNPNNIYGMPAFYPPETLSFSVGKPARECECGGCCIAVDDYTCPRCGKQN